MVVIAKPETNRLLPITVVCIGLLGWAPSLEAASQETPVDVSPCELAKDPPKFDRKLVRLRSRVSLAFEDFSLYPSQCPDARFGIWLDFGGDVEAPTIYCCGDHSREPNRDIQVEEFKIPLLKDAPFESFYNHLTAAREANPDGSLCYDRECYMYDVAATLVGRFFASRGYGHMGLNSLLAIQQVTDVEAIPTGVPAGEAVCSAKAQTWDGPPAISEEACPEDDKDDCLAEQLRGEAEMAWSDTLLLQPRPGVRTGKEITRVSRQYQWRTRDGLLSYILEMVKYCESKWEWDNCRDRPWTTLRLTRIECTPKQR